MLANKMLAHLFKVPHLSSQNQWRMLESGNLSKVKIKWSILGLLMIDKATMENIYIFIVLSFKMCKKIIRCFACYKIYAWCQTQILFMHSWIKPRNISRLDIVSKWAIITGKKVLHNYVHLSCKTLREIM